MFKRFQERIRTQWNIWAIQSSGPWGAVLLKLSWSIWRRAVIIDILGAILSFLSPSQDTNIHLALKGIWGHFCDGECSDATTAAFRINNHFSKADKHNQWKLRNLRSNAKKQFPLMTITLWYVTVQCRISERIVEHTWIWNSSYCAAPALQRAPLCC